MLLPDLKVTHHVLIIYFGICTIYHRKTWIFKHYAKTHIHGLFRPGLSGTMVCALFIIMPGDAETQRGIDVSVCPRHYRSILLYDGARGAR